VIFGRKNRAPRTAPLDAEEPAVEPGSDDLAAEEAETDDGDVVDEVEDDAVDADEAGDESADEDGDEDVRADGPFDASEVDLAGDEVPRLELGVVTLTPFEGMSLQFQGDPQTGTVYSALVMFENSGLQLEVFAAPTAGGLAAELREDTIEEAQQAGGSAEVVRGPFGQEIKRVLPMEGPEGEQLFHVSRIWLVDGPRWLLRGTLMGQASLVEGQDAPADVFVEFFRNIVVHRDDAPRVPGELLTLTLPELPGVAG
jgi:hypothetical protein